VSTDRTWLEHGGIHSNGPVLDDEMLADADIQAAIAHHGTVQKTFKVINTDRTVGRGYRGDRRAVRQQRL
jgi:glutamate synthase (ferredoxin)